MCDFYNEHCLFHFPKACPQPVHTHTHTSPSHPFCFSTNRKCLARSLVFNSFFKRCNSIWSVFSLSLYLQVTYFRFIVLIRISLSSISISFALHAFLTHTKIVTVNNDSNFKSNAELKPTIIWGHDIHSFDKGNVKAINV